MGDMRNLLKMLMMVVFVGWMFVWVMISTNLFKNKWTPKMTKYFNTTYFGPQGISFLNSSVVAFILIYRFLYFWVLYLSWMCVGINLVLLTVPMMFIAVLSCLYLHIQKKPTQTQRFGLLNYHSFIMDYINL